MAKYKNSEGCVLFRYNRGDMQTFLLSNTWISTELCVSSISSQTPLGINLFKHWFVVFPESTRWMDFTNHFTTNVRKKSKHTYYFLLNISRCKFKKKQIISFGICSNQFYFISENSKFSIRVSIYIFVENVQSVEAKLWSLYKNIHHELFIKQFEFVELDEAKVKYPHPRSHRLTHPSFDLHLNFKQTSSNFGSQINK